MQFCDRAQRCKGVARMSAWSACSAQKEGVGGPEYDVSACAKDESRVERWNILLMCCIPDGRSTDGRKVRRWWMRWGMVQWLAAGAARYEDGSSST